MQTKSLLIAILTSAAGLSSSFAQWAAAGNASIALTLTESTPGLYEKDESGKVITEEWEDEETGKVYKYKIPTFENDYTLIIEKGPVDERYTAKEVVVEEEAAKLLTYKFGNAEILNSLKENGDLGEATSIRGWSIVALYDSIEGEVDRTPQFYARHAASKEMIPLEGIELGADDPEETELEVVLAKTKNKTESFSYNSDGDETAYSSSHSHSETWKGRAQMSIMDIVGTGLISGGAKLTVKKVLSDIDEETKEKYYDIYDLYLPSALKIDNILGIGSGESSIILIQGKVAITQGMLVDPGTYFGDI